MGAIPAVRKNWNEMALFIPFCDLGSRAVLLERVCGHWVLRVPIEALASSTPPNRRLGPKDYNRVTRSSIVVATNGG